MRAQKEATGCISGLHTASLLHRHMKVSPDFLLASGASSNRISSRKATAMPDRKPTDQLSRAVQHERDFIATQPDRLPSTDSFEFSPVAFFSWTLGNLPQEDRRFGHLLPRMVNSAPIQVSQQAGVSSGIGEWIPTEVCISSA